jgi:hypothetical protein
MSEDLEKMKQEREQLARRAAELVAMIPQLAKSDPTRPSLVGEKMGIDTRLKQLNHIIASLNRKQNGGSKAIPASHNEIDQRTIARMVAMHAIIVAWAGKKPEIIESLVAGSEDGIALAEDIVDAAAWLGDEVCR